MAYYRLEPFGSYPIFWSAARICLAVVSVAQSWAGKRPTARLEDFLPKFGTRKKSPKELGAEIASVFKEAGAVHVPKSERAKRRRERRAKKKGKE